MKLKLIENKEDVLWKGFNWSRKNLVAGSCDYVNEPLENDQPSESQHLKDDPAQCSLFNFYVCWESK